MVWTRSTLISESCVYSVHSLDKTLHLKVCLFTIYWTQLCNQGLPDTPCLCATHTDEHCGARRAVKNRCTDLPLSLHSTKHNSCLSAFQLYTNKNISLFTRLTQTHTNAALDQEMARGGNSLGWRKSLTTCHRWHVSLSSILALLSPTNLYMYASRISSLACAVLSLYWNLGLGQGLSLVNNFIQV